jgi:prolyl-tRNA synthetase
MEEKGGFILAHWDGTKETEAAIKEETKATIRCIPLDAAEEAGVCVYSGKPSQKGCFLQSRRIDRQIVYF